MSLTPQEQTSGLFLVAVHFVMNYSSKYSVLLSFVSCRRELLKLEGALRLPCLPQLQLVSVRNELHCWTPIWCHRTGEEFSVWKTKPHLVSGKQYKKCKQRIKDHPLQMCQRYLFRVDKETVFEESFQLVEMANRKLMSLPTVLTYWMRQVF